MRVPRRVRIVIATPSTTLLLPCDQGAAAQESRR
jgi:hypothetical protein